MTEKRPAAHSPAEKAHKLMHGSRHPDEREDRAMVKKMVKKEALTGKKHGGAAKAPSAAKKPKTQVNVVVAPRGGSAPASAASGAAPGMAGPSPAAAPTGGLGALSGMPPQAKRGGAIKKHASGGAITGYDAGSVSGEGRLEKVEHMTKIKKKAGLK